MYIKNVFGLLILITSFQKWKKLIVKYVCVCFFFFKVMTCSLISETFSFLFIYKSAIEQYYLKTENW